MARLVLRQEDRSSIYGYPVGRTGPATKGEGCSGSLCCTARSSTCVHALPPQYSALYCCWAGRGWVSRAAGRASAVLTTLVWVAAEGRRLKTLARCVSGLTCNRIGCFLVCVLFLWLLRLGHLHLLGLGWNRKFVTLCSPSNVHLHFGASNPVTRCTYAIQTLSSLYIYGAH